MWIWMQFRSRKSNQFCRNINCYLPPSSAEAAHLQRCAAMFRQADGFPHLPECHGAPALRATRVNGSAALPDTGDARRDTRHDAGREKSAVTLQRDAYALR